MCTTSFPEAILILPQKIISLHCYYVVYSKYKNLLMTVNYHISDHVAVNHLSLQ